MEEKIRKELRTNCETWIFVLPSKALSLGAPTQPTLEDDPPQAPAAGKTPRPGVKAQATPHTEHVKTRPPQLGEVNAVTFQSIQL